VTFQELLDELRDNVLRDTSDIISGNADALWSDETLLRYIKDAERRFARRTLLLRDATTPVATVITLKQGVVTYPCHKSVLSVISARCLGDNYDLSRRGHALIGQTPPVDFLTFDPSIQDGTLPGHPLAYYTDETTVFATQNRVTFSVWPAPSPLEDGLVVNLRVARLPLSTYDHACLNSESEIPEDYQLDMLEWAAFRAQNTLDGDAGAPTPAAGHKANFEEAVERAMKELRRKLFGSTAFRYGSNGFNWTR